MTPSPLTPPDPQLDLVLERVVDVPKELVWAAWTQPEHVKRWFTPAPWTTVDCEIDLRPGGIFRTTMRSPEGQEFPNVGCYLEIVENERLIWTSSLLPGYRPTNRPSESLVMTTAITLEAHGTGTRYMARAMHKDLADRQTHEAMGFQTGWGKALDQLVACAKAF